MDYGQQGLFPNEASSQGGSLAKTYPWLANVLVWLEREAVSSTKSPGLLTKLKPNGLSSKTYLASSQVSEEQTWEQLSERWSNSGMAWHGECLMHSTLEFPKDGGVSSSLRNVLETQPVLPKFYLSARACEGILRRAERRGKTLPEALDKALRNQLSTNPTTTMLEVPPASPTPLSPEWEQGGGQVPLAIEPTGFNAYNGLDISAAVGLSPTLRVGDGGGASVMVEPVAFDEMNFTTTEMHQTLRAGTPQSTGIVEPANGGGADELPASRALPSRIGDESRHESRSLGTVFGQTGFARYTEGATTLTATTYKRAEDNVVVHQDTPSAE
jgi:hypothetical protein